MPTTFHWNCYTKEQEIALIHRIKADDDSAIEEIYISPCVRRYVIGYLRGFCQNHPKIRLSDDSFEDIFTDAVLDFRDFVQSPKFYNGASIGTLLCNSVRWRAFTEQNKQNSRKIYDTEEFKEFGIEYLLDDFFIKISPNEFVNKEELKEVVCEKLELLDDNSEEIPDTFCSHYSITEFLKYATQTSYKVCCLLLKDKYKIYCSDEISQMTEEQIRETIEREPLSDETWANILVYHDSKTNKEKSYTKRFIREKRTRCLRKLIELIQENYNII